MAGAARDGSPSRRSPKKKERGATAASKSKIRQTADADKSKKHEKAAVQLARRIKHAAQHLGGNRQLAARLQLSPQSISNWTSTTAPRTPSATNLADIASATGCDPGWLLTGQGDPFPKPRINDPQGQARATAGTEAVADAIRVLLRALSELEPWLPTESAKRFVGDIERATDVISGSEK